MRAPTGPCASTAHCHCAAVNYALGKLAVRTSRNRQQAGDTRRTALQELISDIRTVKLFGWSSAWIERVEAKRRTELRWLATGALLLPMPRRPRRRLTRYPHPADFAVRYAYTMLWIIISLLVPLVSFWAYVKVQGEELTVAVAFTALSLFVLCVSAFSCDVPSH